MYCPTRIHGTRSSCLADKARRLPTVSSLSVSILSIGKAGGRTRSGVCPQLLVCSHGSSSTGFRRGASGRSAAYSIVVTHKWIGQRLNGLWSCVLLVVISRHCTVLYRPCRVVQLTVRCNARESCQVVTVRLPYRRAERSSAQPQRSWFSRA